jgi:hypothetical protein
VGCLLVVLLIIAAIAFDGHLRARCIGLLMLLGGPFLWWVAIDEKNPFVKFRNSMFLIPIGVGLLLAGLAALVSGEIPAWFLEATQRLLDRSKRVAH